MAANLMKDLDSEGDIEVQGDTITATLSWKTTTGGAKGITGRVKKAIEIDLDEQAVLYGTDGPKDLCYHGNLDPVGNGSIVLGKDAGSGGAFGALKRLGKGAEAGSQEQIVAKLSDLPPWVDSFVVLASAFKDGVAITDAESVSLVLTDGGQEIYMKPTITDSGNTCLMARVYRSGGTWRVRKVNRMVTAHSRGAMLTAAAGV